MSFITEVICKFIFTDVHMRNNYRPNRAIEWFTQPIPSNGWFMEERSRWLAASEITYFLNQCFFWKYNYCLTVQVCSIKYECNLGILHLSCCHCCDLPESVASLHCLSHMCPCSTKAVISNTGIFVAIDNNTLYGSKLSIFLLCQKSLGY